MASWKAPNFATWTVLLVLDIVWLSDRRIAQHLYISSIEYYQDAYQKNELSISNIHGQNGVSERPSEEVGESQQEGIYEESAILG